ncbi:MAG: M1 family peptidase [Gammaproteobacteria bacterium]|nr:M1 family peptidase [Gammaproteobacteria bacterium]
MTWKRILQQLLLATCLLPLSLQAQLHHRLQVQLNPQLHSIVVIDDITRTDTRTPQLEFQLHRDLTPVLMGSAGHLEALSSRTGEKRATTYVSSQDAELLPRRYRVVLPAGQEHFVLRYQGHIHHALRQQGEEYARGFRETSGMIDAEGVFLAGQSYWYPHVEGEQVSFELHLLLPPDWNGMTQGERLARTAAKEQIEEHWRCNPPQQEIYLIAGRFSEYTRKTHGVEAMVLLREPDAILAEQYLDATAEYVQLYSDLIAPYPYAKFALVENFWETGYGMPSFTLLGPRVIRFPFILHTSYPHEILHNWWGNSVYVDYESGNWAEGLTSYLADHLFKEQRGLGADYRRGVLQKYTDYVHHQQDFPLSEFRSRHSEVSEAVGYGKTLMLFHMLRRQLGDATFREGLQALYHQRRYQVTGFEDVESIFSTVAGDPLDPFFAQWVDRSGAPSLQVTDVHAWREGERNFLSAVIEQTQPGPGYTLRVPLAVQLEGTEMAWQTEVLLDSKAVKLERELPAAPLRLEVDPEFDVFRRLERSEIPPAISQAMGADQVMMVLPAASPSALRAAYSALAAAWQAGDPDRFSIALDRDLEKLPDDRAVWLFGWDNRFRTQLTQALAGYAFSDHGDTLTIAGRQLSRTQHATVVMARHPGNPEQALAWLAADEPATLTGLGRKLPHYGGYSYLAFSGNEPDNVLKGRWPVQDSPLSVNLTNTSTPMRLAPRAPLVTTQRGVSTAP